MKAADVMMKDVISIAPDVTVQEAAKLMGEKGISGVPVIDADGRLLGLLSEGDLIRRSEIGTEPRRSLWLQILSGRQLAAADFVKANARKVADVMTRDVVTVEESTPIDQVATAMEARGIKRVPVLRNGKVVGIVSRANLVRALAGSMGARLPDIQESDRVIQERVMERIRSQPFGMPWLMTVTAENGTVTLWGPLSSEMEHKAIRVAAETTPGVRALKDNLFPWPARAA